MVLVLHIVRFWAMPGWSPTASMSRRSVSCQRSFGRPAGRRPGASIFIPDFATASSLARYTWPAHRSLCSRLLSGIGATPACLRIFSLGIRSRSVCPRDQCRIFISVVANRRSSAAKEGQVSELNLLYIYDFKNCVSAIPALNMKRVACVHRKLTVINWSQPSEPIHSKPYEKSEKSLISTILQFFLRFKLIGKVKGLLNGCYMNWTKSKKSPLRILL